jgi:hypothetical protein
MGDLVTLKRTVLDFYSQHSSMWEMIMEILTRLFMLARVLLTSNHADYGAVLTDCCRRKIFH